MHLSSNATSSSALRVSDAERDACVAALIDHHLDGRLSVEEFDRRQRSALAAVTTGDLAVLLTDLPAVGHVARRGASRRIANGTSDTVMVVGSRALSAGAVVGCAWLSQVAWQFSAEGPFLGAIAGGAVGYVAHAAFARYRR